MDLPEPYIVTSEELIDFKLSLLNLKEGEVLIDLGCGNASVLIKAHQLSKIKGIGYELRPEVIEEAKVNIQEHDLQEHITIIAQNFSDADVSKADAVCLYLTRWSLGDLSLKLENELKPGTRVVTHDFDIPAWTEKEKHLFTTKQGLEHDVYLYIVS